MRSLRTLVFLLLLVAGGTANGNAQQRDVLPRHAAFGAAVASYAGNLVIDSVLPGSAAAVAGFEKGDVLKTFDGNTVTGVAQFLGLVRHEPGGKSVAVEILRGNAAQTLHATLVAAPDEHDTGVDTSYESVTVDGSLRRTLITVPTGKHGRLPAVLLIGGIGCFTVDTATNPNDAYKRITHDMARAGFVTMRLEKSDVGDSRGPVCHDVDFTSESNSYAVALDALSKDPRVDPDHVYLLGHSIGTVIAPRLALTHHIAGMIAAAAVGRNWFEYELINLRRQLTITGETPETVDVTMRSKESCMHRLLIAHEPEAQIERDDPACKMRNGIYPVTDSYVQQVAALNIIEPWTKLNIPVLAIYGTSDLVVDRDDHERIIGVVNSAHPGAGTFRSIDALDHSLLVAASPAIAAQDSASGVAEPYNTAFSAAVVDWLCQREHCTKG